MLRRAFAGVKIVLKQSSKILKEKYYIFEIELIDIFIDKYYSFQRSSVVT